MNKTKPSPTVSLRPLQDEDRFAMIEMITDPKVSKTYMLPSFDSKEEIDNLFVRLKRLSEDRNRFAFGIYSSGLLVGYINEVSKERNSIEIGYFISSKEWNKGYATSALRLAIDMLFKTGYSTVRAAHFAENTASGRVMEKTGMTKTDYVETVFYRGEEHRCVYYEIHKPKAIE